MADELSAAVPAVQHITLNGGDVVEIPEDQPRLVVHQHAIAGMFKQLANAANAFAHQAVQETDEVRQHLEDTRANRRNRNRFLTLLVALIGASFLPSLMVSLWGAASLKYSFAVTIVPDAFITGYAYWRKY